MQAINNFFIAPPAGVDPNKVLEVLIAVKVPQGRPQWNQQLKSWIDLMGKDKETEKR